LESFLESLPRRRRRRRDLLKLLEEDCLRIVARLNNDTYETEEQSSDVTKITIVFKKTQKATKYSDHRTISLIVHIAQIVARILRVRIERKIEDILGKDLFGFKIGKGTIVAAADGDDIRRNLRTRNRVRAYRVANGT
jgi:hypothetical protein